MSWQPNNNNNNVSDEEGEIGEEEGEILPAPAAAKPPPPKPPPPSSSMNNKTTSASSSSTSNREPSIPGASSSSSTTGVMEPSTTTPTVLDQPLASARPAPPPPHPGGEERPGGGLTRKLSDNGGNTTPVPRRPSWTPPSKVQQQQQHDSQQQQQHSYRERERGGPHPPERSGSFHRRANSGGGGGGGRGPSFGSGSSRNDAPIHASGPSTTATNAPSREGTGDHPPASSSAATPGGLPARPRDPRFRATSISSVTSSQGLGANAETTNKKDAPRPPPPVPPRPTPAPESDTVNQQDKPQPQDKSPVLASGGNNTAIMSATNTKDGPVVPPKPPPPKPATTQSAKATEPAPEASAVPEDTSKPLETAIATDASTDQRDNSEHAPARAVVPAVETPKPAAAPAPKQAPALRGSSTASTTSSSSSVGPTSKQPPSQSVHRPFASESRSGPGQQQPQQQPLLGRTNSQSRMEPGLRRTNSGGGVRGPPPPRIEPGLQRTNSGEPAFRRTTSIGGGSGLRAGGPRNHHTSSEPGLQRTNSGEGGFGRTNSWGNHPPGRPRVEPGMQRNPGTSSSNLPVAGAPAAVAAVASPVPQPTRPAFHRRDPRARLQQQQQQQAQGGTVAAALGAAVVPPAAAPFNRADSNLVGSNVGPRLGRTGSGPMDMQGPPGDRHVPRGGRNTWTSGHGPNHHPPQQHHAQRSQSHGTNMPEDAHHRRRMSLPEPPSQRRDNIMGQHPKDRPGYGAGGRLAEGVDAFGRSSHREWGSGGGPPHSNNRGPPHQQLQREGSGRFNSNPNASPHPSPHQRRSFTSVDGAPLPPRLQSSPSKTMSSDHVPIPRRNSLSGGPPIPLQVGSGGVPKKKQATSPLLTTILGESKVISRADVAVKHLEDVLQIKKDAADADAEKAVPSQGPKPLPSKVQIMKAMALLDMKTKKIEQERKDVEEKIENAKEEEARAEKTKTGRREQEQTEKAMAFVQEHRKERESEHDDKMKVWRDRKKQTLGEELKAAEEKLVEQIKVAQESEAKRLAVDLKEQVQQAAEQLDRDIAKMKRESEKATQAVSKSQAKSEMAQEEYDAAVKKTAKKGKPAKVTKSKQAPWPNTCDVVKSILAQNQRKAAEMHVMASSMVVTSSDESSADNKQDWIDPKHGISSADWTQKIRMVTGPANAIYNEPSEAPFFKQNANLHKAIAPLAKEYVRDKKRRIDSAFSDLAEEYDYRNRKYNKHLMLQRRRGKAGGSSRGSLSISRQSILGGKPAANSGTAPTAGVTAGVVAGRSTSNPYRRARRGNEVRSEYEQEQIIAELAAKEAMEKRIAFGGCKPAQQILPLEQKLGARYINTLEAQRVDPVAIEEDLKFTSIWSDMEKCIFLDRFLQFPKDFRKISTFLRNKNTKDCVRFYYDSKQYVPYKAALKEHMLRRKRRGDYPVWDATIQAALSVGAIISAGPNEQKPLVFALPDNDFTFWTKDFHPLQRSLFDKAGVGEGGPEDFDEDEYEAAGKRKGVKPSLRYKREPFFNLAKEEKKFIKSKSKGSGEKETRSIPLKKMKLKPIVEEDEPPGDMGKTPSSATPPRKAPQKWTSTEKKIFVDTLEKHGRNWALLASAVGTKTIYQIKNYYYDYKKQAGKFRSEKKTKDDDKSGKEDDAPKVKKPKKPSGILSRESSGNSSKKEQEQQLEQLREEQRLIQEQLEQRQEAHHQQQQLQQQQEAERQKDQEIQQQQQQQLLEQQQQEQHLQRRQQLLALQHSQQQQPQSHQDQHQRLLEQHQEQQRLHQQALALQQQQQQQSQQRQLQQLMNQQQNQHTSQQQQLLRQRLQHQHAQPSLVESHEGGGNSDFAAELWAQAQRQALLSQHHQQHQGGGHMSSAEAEARSLLQHHSQSHHQQVLSNLMPWLQATQQQQQHAPNNDSASQHLQTLLALRQQQAAGGSRGGHSSGATASSASPSAAQLRSLALAGLSGLNAGGSAPHAASHHAPQQHAHSRMGGGEEANDGNLALVQRLLAMQQQQHGGGGGRGGLQGADAQALDALGLLAGSGPRQPDGNNNQNNPQGPPYR